MSLPFGSAYGAARDAHRAACAADDAASRANSVEEQLRELQSRHEKLLLANQVLWEIVREATGLTDSDFEQRLALADSRDGLADARMTRSGVDCPACNRKTSSARPTCMYCGEKVSAPLFARF